MANTIKTEKVNKLKEKIAASKSLIFAEYHGLDVNQINDLRVVIKEAGGEMTVAKNTLMKVALEDKSDEINETLKGPIATIFSYEDAIAPIKAIADFAKKFNLPTIKAGIVNGEFQDATKIKILSELPSKDELIARLVGGLKSPLTGIANVLSGTNRNFVYVLSAIADKRGEEESN